MKIGKVIIEIDGVSHKLIRSRTARPCESCSVHQYCIGTHNNIFVKMCSCSTLKGIDGKFIICKDK